MSRFTVPPVFGDRMMIGHPPPRTSVESLEPQLATLVEGQNLQLIFETIRAWNRYDPDRYAALLADEFVAEVQGRRRVVRGRDGARQLMRAWFNAFPDLRFVLKATAASGDRVFITWQATGTLRDYFSSQPSINRPLEAHGCSVVTLRHGAIIRTWTYWNSDELLKHIDE